MLYSFDLSVTWPLAPTCWSITTSAATTYKRKQQHQLWRGQRQLGQQWMPASIFFFASSLLFLAFFHRWAARHSNSLPRCCSLFFCTPMSLCMCVCLYVYVARFGNIFQELLILNNSKVRWTHHKHTLTHAHTVTSWHTAGTHKHLHSLFTLLCCRCYFADSWPQSKDG